MELTENAKRLLKLMDRPVPDLDGLRAELQKGVYAPSEMTCAFIQYLEDNSWEYQDLLMESEEPTPEDMDALHTRYALAVLKVLHEYGADLDAKLDGTSILSQCIMCDVPGVGAAIAQYALSYGACDRLVNDCGDNFIDAVESEIEFEQGEGADYHLDNLLKLYMIALGYGCEYMDGTVLTEGYNGFDLYKFRDYARYDAEAFAFEGKKKYRFYEKETGKTVFLY